MMERALLFKLADTAIALEADGGATPLDHRETMWTYAVSGVYGDVSRLIVRRAVTADWTSWEMHPAGDEVIMLLEGDIELQIECEGQHTSVVLDQQQSFARIPRGAWHTLSVQRPATLLFVTPEAGTRQRPRADRSTVARQLMQLHAPAFCGKCGSLVTQSARFRWGAVPEAYNGGDSIRWWRRTDGSIEAPFQKLPDDDARWNFGDPACERVIVLDEDITDSPHGIQCPRCGLIFAGVAVRISGGVLEWPFLEKEESIAELRNGWVEPLKAFEELSDHTVVVRADWYRASEKLRDK
jgi:mannose-6-phosphate isomerase-like protein (cupin superfamily)